MFKINRLDGPGDATTIALIGHCTQRCLPALTAALAEARALELPIFLDLKDVTLVDREAMAFLHHTKSQGVAVSHCPLYVQRWINQETGESAAAEESCS